MKEYYLYDGGFAELGPYSAATIYVIPVALSHNFEIPNKEKHQQPH